MLEIAQYIVEKIDNFAISLLKLSVTLEVRNLLVSSRETSVPPRIPLYYYQIHRK